MIGRNSFFWNCRGLFFALVVMTGCNSAAPPVAETPPPPVSVSQPLVGEVTDHDDFDGRIAAVETVEVRARIRGHVQKVNFQDGQIVKKGDMLFEIDPRPYKATLDAAAAQKAAADASLELAKERIRPGIPLCCVHVRQVEKKSTSGRASRPLPRPISSKPKLPVEWQGQARPRTAPKVAAAIDGKTSRALVTTGNLVNAGSGDTLLTTITSVEPMYVYFDVDERALARYRRHFRKGIKEGEPEPSIKEMKIPIQVGLEGEEGFPHTGVIDFTDNRVNPSTGTIQVRGVLSNHTRTLDAGMRARVRVPVSDPHKAVMVTERAVGTDQGLKFVYVVNDQKVVERRDVKLERLSDGLQVVGEGIKPEDWVIVNGIQRVRDGMTVDPKQVPMPGAPAKPTNPAPKS